jgi:hypothetical protein
MMYKCQTYCGCALIAILVSRMPPALAEPLRGIELDPNAPESVVRAFAGSGINTLVVPYLKQGDLNDPTFVQSLSRWGRLAGKYKLRCLVAIRLFGPSDYTGAEGSFVGGVEALVGGAPCVSPADPNYWSKVVTPRVRRIAELAKRNGLSGALFDYQATLSGMEYNAVFCFSDLCWHAFVRARRGGDEKMLKFGTRERVNWVQTSLDGGDYYALLSELVEAEMRKTVRAARELLPDMVIGVYGCWDTWFYRGVIRAASEGGGDGGDKNLPPAVFAEHEHASLAKLLPFLKTGWKKANLSFMSVARLPLDYYLPNDVQNQIADAELGEVGFLLTSTDSLWRAVADLYHVYPPNGSASAFAAAIRGGLAGQPAERHLLFNKPHYTQWLPRLAVLHGQGLSGLFSDVIKRLAQSFQLTTLQLDASHPEQWCSSLSLCDIIAVLPGAGMTNPKGLSQAAPAIERFLRNGGLVFLMNAGDGRDAGWFVSHSPRFALEGEPKSGLKQAWLANEGNGLLATPIYAEKVPPTGVHFRSFAPQYEPLAKDDLGGAYLLKQEVGRGLLIVSAGPVVSTDLMANAFLHLRRRGEVFNVGLLPGADTVRFGQNDLVLGVAELPESAGNLDVAVDLIDAGGKVSTQQFSNVSVGGDGLRIPVRYTATREGVGNAVVSLADPADGALLRRFSFPLLHDQRVEVLPDKNYYTTEPQAVLRFRFADKALAIASVQIALAGVDLRPELTGDDVRLAKVAIAGLKPGEHRLDVSFLLDGKTVCTRVATIRKEPPFPGAVKILYHQYCILEVDGRPLFPYGCYGIGEAQEGELVQLGINTTIGGNPGKGNKLWVAGQGLAGWALSKDWPRERVLETLRGEGYGRLLSWYMYDEPELNGQSPDFVHGVYEAGRRKDPYHPQMVVYVGSAGYPHYPDYMPAADCHMMDHYPLPYLAPATYGMYLRKVTEAARGTRNVWGVPQCFDWREIGTAFGPFTKESLHPNGREALNYIYQSIVEGAGAITFWTYRYVVEDPRRRGPFLKALAEGAKLTDLVVRGTLVGSPQVRPFSAQVRCRSFRIGNEVYIVAANYLERKAEVEFSASYLKQGSLRQHLPIPRQLEALKDTFEPLEGKVYVVTSP